MIGRQNAIRNLLNVCLRPHAALLAATLFCGSAMAVPTSVYVATDQTGAQTFINRTDVSYWTFATNSNAVANFTGGFFHVKKGGGSTLTADIKFAVIAGTYSTFTASYSNGVYSGSSVISDSKLASQITGSFTSQTFAGTPVTLAANTTYTAVVWSAATGSGNDTYFIKNNGNIFWSDSSGNAIDPGGYTPGQDLLVSGSPVGVPGAGLASLAVVGLVARRRRR